ncbi:unnamed protein product [Paramecium octaurelia]|uniref:Uncharacterized protein n=1 Tax=Paramecium octaurelia TaxID=43137 RepID=A0A8S1X2V4_PAROT|nr:unnamed protein product [Paramecium octaurelia]
MIIKLKQIQFAITSIVYSLNQTALNVLRRKKSIKIILMMLKKSTPQVHSLNIKIKNFESIILFFIKKGISFKYSLQKERIASLNSQQINDDLNSNIKLIEYKQSITPIISDQIQKLNNTFNNLLEQLKLSSFNYYQKDDISIILSKELYAKGYDLLDELIY